MLNKPIVQLLTPVTFTDLCFLMWQVLSLICILYYLTLDRQLAIESQNLNSWK